MPQDDTRVTPEGMLKRRLQLVQGVALVFFSTIWPLKPPIQLDGAVVTTLALVLVVVPLTGGAVVPLVVGFGLVAGGGTVTAGVLVASCVGSVARKFTQERTFRAASALFRPASLPSSISTRHFAPLMLQPRRSVTAAGTPCPLKPNT